MNSPIGKLMASIIMKKKENRRYYRITHITKRINEDFNMIELSTIIHSMSLKKHDQRSFHSRIAL